MIANAPATLEYAVGYRPHWHNPGRQPSAGDCPVHFSPSACLRTAQTLPCPVVDRGVYGPVDAPELALTQNSLIPRKPGIA
jgi:hypothetical protein